MLKTPVYDDTHFEGLVYGSDMANTLTYCSATKLAYRCGSRTNAADEKESGCILNYMHLKTYYSILIGQKVRMGGVRQRKACTHWTGTPAWVTPWQRSPRCA